MAEGGPVADSPFDEAVPLDGMVGSLSDPEEAPPMWKPEGFLRVSVSGDAVSGSHAMGLAEDLELLVHSLVQRPASIAVAQTEVCETSPSTRGNKH